LVTNSVLGYRHTGLGRVGSRVTHQLQNVGRVGFKELTRVQATQLSRTNCAEITENGTTCTICFQH